MKKNLTILFLLLPLVTSCINKNSPEYVARQYLLAIKDKNWDEAKKYATPELRQTLEFCDSIGCDFGILEVRDIKCDVKFESGQCTYCCSSDTITGNQIKLHKENGKWLVRPNKESAPPNKEDSLKHGWK